MFGLTMLEDETGFKLAAGDLQADETRFLHVMIQTSQLIFVSEWSGLNVVDCLRSAPDKENRRKISRGLGVTLAALHHHDLIAGDTNLDQFVVRGETDTVLRVDLVNIYHASQAGGEEGFETERAMVLFGLARFAPQAINDFEETYQRETDALK